MFHNPSRAQKTAEFAQNLSFPTWLLLFQKAKASCNRIMETLARDRSMFITQYTGKYVSKKMTLKGTRKPSLMPSFRL